MSVVNLIILEANLFFFLLSTALKQDGFLSSGIHQLQDDSNQRSEKSIGT